MTMPPPAEHQPAAPTYVDPITGASLHVDPDTGQLAYDHTPQPPTTPLPGPGPIADATTPLAAGGFPAPTPMPAPGAFPTPGPNHTLPEPGYVPSDQAPDPGHSAPSYAYPGYPAPGAYPANSYPGAAPGYAYPVSSYPYAPGARTNGMSIAALVVSVTAFPLLSCYGLGALIGLAGAILGHVARKQIRERGEAGGGLALAGIICGWISLALGVIIVGLIVWFFVALNNASAIDDY